MRTPYGLEIIESCMGCKASRAGFFCRLAPSVLRSMDEDSHHTVMPAGALLFVEGQTPRGVFVLCSGKVKLYTTSKEGKVLILKQAEAGEVLGLRRRPAPLMPCSDDPQFLLVTSTFQFLLTVTANSLDREGVILAHSHERSARLNKFR